MNTLVAQHEPGHEALPQRFWEKVKITADCWLWTGGGTPAGYGHLLLGARSVYAHRAAYEAYIGPIPAGLEIDHLCMRTSCVNPAHLEAVTTRENTLRSSNPAALNAAKTECSRGHAFNAANTYSRPDGGRDCRQCRRMHHDAWVARTCGAR